MAFSMEDEGILRKVFDDTPARSPSGVSDPLLQIPDTSSFEGDFDFKVSFPENSSKLIVQAGENGVRKLYTTDGEAVTAFAKHRAGKDTKLRIFICYKDSTLMAKPVHPCKDNRKEAHPNHMMDIVGSNEVQWFDRPHPSIVVHTDLQPSIIQNDYKLQLIFLCRNSCIKRKGLYLVFQLEQWNHAIGRETLELKVSACPKRDSRGKRTFGEALLENKKVFAKVPKLIDLADTPKFYQANQGSNTSQPKASFPIEPACDSHFQNPASGNGTGLLLDPFMIPIHENLSLEGDPEINLQQIHQEEPPTKQIGGGSRVVDPKEFYQDDDEKEMFQMLGEERRKDASKYMLHLFLLNRFRELHPEEYVNEENKFMARFRKFEGI